MMTITELRDRVKQSDIVARQGDYAAAEKLANDVLAELDSRDEISPEIMDIRAQAIIAIAWAYEHSGKYNFALALAQQGLAIAVEYALPQAEAKAWNVLGNVNMYRGSYDTALECFEKTEAIRAAIGDKAGVASVKGNIGLVYERIGRFDKALEYFNEALPIHQELGNKRMEGGTLVNIGSQYSHYGAVEQALEYYSKALAIFEEIGEKPFKANVLGNIGNMYRFLGAYHQALEYTDKSLALQEELGVKFRVASQLSSKGGIYQLLGDFDKALEYLVQALALHEEMGSKSGIAGVTGNIGYLYRVLPDHSKSLEYSKKALALNEEMGYPGGVAQCLDNIGGVYADRNFELYDCDLAEEYLLRAIEIFHEIGDHRVYECYQALADLYHNENRWEESDRYFRKFYEAEKAVRSEDAKKKAMHIELQSRAAEREKEIAIAKAKADAEMSVTTTLLHKVLPSSIANRLIKGEKVADYFQVISILFADIVGFTPIASKMPARKVLAFLNYVFGEFDRIIEKHGCEKIKTIGDGYMAVAGAPIECSDHAERIARAAIEMMGDIHLPDDIRAALPKGAKFSIRIGVNIGPAFGGIVGENRFVYDIYSDAVNTAARMESYGEPNKIHVSEEFAFHLQNRMDMTGDDLGGIIFEERDEIEIKGKGIMKTYFLEKA
ncbi:MAG: tetratricopeptide repeat protein [Bacteroidetes bacterium]|nr:tetratricopeptide repeat protein [Bacteroidota bacterium]